MTSITLKQRIMILLITITLILSGMCNLYQDTDSFLSYSHSAHILSVSEFDKQMDSFHVRPGVITDEIKASIISEVKEELPSKANVIKSFIAFLILSMVPIIVGIVLSILLQHVLENKMYLITYIHKSDGKKGDRLSILTA